MKFIYLADTHIGGSDTEGYRRQPRYVSRFQEIFDCLNNYIEESGDIDFVIHGGDMIDKTTEESIDMAVAFFKHLPCPTYLALGNHDLTTPDSVQMWLDEAPQFFPDGRTDFSLVKDGVRIDIAVSNWGETPVFWDPKGPQFPWLSAEQLETISESAPDCHTRIIATHPPVYGLPPEQHGGDAPIHTPAGDFTEKLSSAVKHASLVLGAHNHMNMALRKDNCYFVTASAFSETPFEFKVVEATRDALSMQTVELGSKVPFRAMYDFESTYVQGRPSDRRFTMEERSAPEKS